MAEITSHSGDKAEWASIPLTPAARRLQARTHTRRIIAAGLAAVFGMTFYLAVSLSLTPFISRLYGNTLSVSYAPSHYYDARQYVLICAHGYYVPKGDIPTLQRSRINWMPFYPLMHCALNRFAGISLIFTGLYISTASAGAAVFLGALTLGNLGVRYPVLHALAVLMPLIGGAWLYLPGAEAIYLAVGMAVLYLITLPPGEDTARGRLAELFRAVLGVLLGVIFILTKPNALAMILPLLFAFLYLSWRRSTQAGYAFGLWTFTADIVIEHLRPALALVFALARRGASQDNRPPLRLEDRPVRYMWTPLAVAVGVLLGFAYWLLYTSYLSGIPNYFMQQQLNVWGRAWAGGNVVDMVTYFAQAFRSIDSSGSPWRYVAAWNLAANVAALVPAASPRVPTVIRGMLPLMVGFILYSGAVHGSDRYILSTALVALGWACWLAPQSSRPRSRFWAALRWIFLIAVAAITSYMLVVIMFPRSEPNAWGIVEW